MAWAWTALLKPSVVKIAIDLTIDTAFSLTYKWTNFMKKEFKKNTIKSALSDFNLILTVAGRKDIADNAYNIYPLE